MENYYDHQDYLIAEHAVAMRPKKFSAPTQPMLSDSEIELLTQLREVKHDSLWGAVISDVVNAKRVDVKAFRNLVCQLKSQAFDNPMVMQKIIGTDCYESLISLK